MPELGDSMSDSDDEDAVRICHNCVDEPFLKALIERDAAVGDCGYCGDDEERCILVEELADHVEGAFERHYVRTSPDPDMYEDMLIRDKEIDYDWYRHGEPVLDVIQEVASVAPEVARDVLDILEDRHGDLEAAQMGDECEFDGDSHYEWKGVGDQEIAAEWHDLQRSLKVRARYFNAEVEAFMARLFDGVDGQATRDGDPVIVLAGPDQETKQFYRARTFHHAGELDDALLRPDVHLGPPPAAKARAGRMNAHGISVFYGAFDGDVALAEVRPPVGSRAVVGEFALTCEVRLLDVTALQSLYVEGSVFDPAYVDRLALAKFMSRLSDRITMPVMPDDEPTEYLITQMIADYLARRPAPGLDGILFRSVQRPADEQGDEPTGQELPANGDPAAARPARDLRNVVLFHHASRVEALEMLEGTELSVHQFQSTEDGPEPDYTVWEQVPPAPDGSAAPPAEAADDVGLGAWAVLRPHALAYDLDADGREPYLKVAKDSLVVRHVTGVSFRTEDFEVRRHRMEKRDYGF